MRLVQLHHGGGRDGHGPRGPFSSSYKTASWWFKWAHVSVVRAPSEGDIKADPLPPRGPTQLRAQRGATTVWGGQHSPRVAVRCGSGHLAGLVGSQSPPYLPGLHPEAAGSGDSLRHPELPPTPPQNARAVPSTENPTGASGGNARRPQPGTGAHTPWPRGRVSMAQGLAPERWADGRQAAPTPHSTPRARSPCAPTSPSPPSRSLARDGERPVVPPDLHPCSTPRRRGNCRRLWLDSGTSVEAKAAGCGEKPTASPPPTASIAASGPAGPQGAARFPGERRPS